MQLKVKFLKLTAGRPVAILNKKLAEKISIHVDERIIIRKNSHKTIAVIDIATGMLKENEIVVSTEISRALNLKEGDSVYIEPSPKPASISAIMKKLKCKILKKEEILAIIKDIVENALTEAEIAYFISAVNNCGMSLQEIRNMTLAIVKTGKHFRLKGKIADKHGVGGIPGRTTPIVVPICASAGLIMPKTSSRAITSSAGTADALEVICKVDFSVPEIKRIVKKTGACMVWGGSLGLAPADDKIIQVERLLNLDPEAQLLSSIMAKKIAVGSKYILIEIPYGKNAKVSRNQAVHLKKKFESLGKSFHVKLKCLAIETREPLGNGIGPALEIKDVIKVLKRESSCHKLESRSLILASALLELAGKSKKGEGMRLAKEILESGKAYFKFREIIKAQGGNIKNIREAKYRKKIVSGKNFKICEINIKKINELARILGCPADKYAGICLNKHLGDNVKKNELVATLYSESKPELIEGFKFFKKEEIIK